MLPRIHFLDICYASRRRLRDSMRCSRDCLLLRQSYSFHPSMMIDGALFTAPSAIWHGRAKSTGWNWTLTSGLSWNTPLKPPLYFAEFLLLLIRRIVGQSARI